MNYPRLEPDKALDELWIHVGVQARYQPLIEAERHPQKPNPDSHQAPSSASRVRPGVSLMPPR